jgi:uncharacterized protein YaiE (UPF0345 family)
VAIGLNPAKPENVFFTDEAVTASYAVGCATEAVVGVIKYTNYAAALAALESGQTIDDGSGSGIVYREGGPQWPGILTGSKALAGSAPGLYAWYVGATNKLNGSTCSQTLAFQVIGRPGTTAACAPYQGCLDKWVQFIKPRIASRITNNAALDGLVDAFAQKVYDRQVIGMRLDQELLATGNITCTTACTGSEINSGQITIDFCPSKPPTDYALLHELVHRVGFDNRIFAAYTGKGLVPPSNNQVEIMAARVAGAVFEGTVARVCSQY